MTEDFIRARITQLRMKKGVSEYQMSYDLGHSRGYVYNISSGKALPVKRASDPGTPISGGDRFSSVRQR